MCTPLANVMVPTELTGPVPPGTSTAAAFARRTRTPVHFRWAGSLAALVRSDNVATVAGVGNALPRAVRAMPHASVMRTSATGGGAVVVEHVDLTYEVTVALRLRTSPGAVSSGMPSVPLGQSP